MYLETRGSLLEEVDSTSLRLASASVNYAVWRLLLRTYIVLPSMSVNVDMIVVFQSRPVAPRERQLTHDTLLTVMFTLRAGSCPYVELGSKA